MVVLKKFLIILISLALLIPVAYFSIYIIQNITLTRSYVDYNEGQGADSFIRCNLNILEPEFASVFFAMEKGHISFKKTEMFSQTDEEWIDSYTGGTTVQNVTFDELVAMVKEDCSQFQEDYDNPLVDEGGIDWGYREADPPEPPKTEEELEFEEKQEYYSAIKSMKLQFDYFTALQKEKFTEFYGDINSMTDDEIYQVVEQLRKNGDMVDESIKQYFFDEDGNPILE